MPRWAQRTLDLLPAVWLGLLLCVSLVATPAGFALLPKVQAGALAGRILGQEALLSLTLGVAVLMLERWRRYRLADSAIAPTLSTNTLLALGAVACTVVGYYALQGPMEQARAGQGRFGFTQLHTFSLAAYGIKVLLVALLAWRGAGGRPPGAPSQPSS